MLASGTQTLVEGLAGMTSHCAGTAHRPALWVLDASGEVVARSRPEGADEPEFRLEEGVVQIRGVSKDELSVVRPITLPDGEELWLALIDESRRGAEALGRFTEIVVALLEAEGQREFESEDTTEHLLSLFEQIRAIHDLADRLPSCTNFEDKSRLCLTSLMLAVNARMSMLLLQRDKPGDYMGIVMSEGASGSWTIETKVDLEREDPVAEVLRTGNHYYGWVKDFDIPSDSLAAEASDCFLAAPVRFGTEENPEVFGTILLLDRLGESAPKGYGNPEAELVGSVGVLLGLLVGTEKRVHAEKELDIASTIQETLVPKRPPVWEGLSLAGRNQTAGQVGGDYLDFVQSPDGVKHAIIADVSGHNMASAMAMIMARTRFLAVIDHENSPARIVEELNKGLFEDLTRNELFITVFLMSFLVEIPDGGYRVDFCSAGHNPPLLLRKDGSIEWLDGGGPMVGFMAGIDFDEVGTDLHPGDLVVLYTDGVSEAENEQGEMFETDGLVRTVQKHAKKSAQEILDGIYEAVAHHAGPTAEADDITVIVIKVEDA